MLGVLRATTGAAGVAVPLRATARGLPAALSVIDRLAELGPTTAGTKTMLIEQLAPGVTSALAPAHPLVSLKSAGFAPATATENTLSPPVPLLEILSVWAGAARPIGCAPKLKVVELSATEGAGTAPVPLSVTLRGPPGSLLDTTTDPLTGPLAAGAKLTVNAQLAAGANVTPVHGAVTESATKKTGVVAAAEPMVRGLSPLLVTVTVWGALKVLLVWSGNVRLAGVAAREGARSCP
jgi:hypothetical protein